MLRNLLRAREGILPSLQDRHVQASLALHAYAGVSAQGLIVGTPIGEKSETLRVTTVMPWLKAVAAISASRSGRRSGT